MRESTYRFGDVEVEVGGRELRRGGIRVALEPKALDVLFLLLAEPGRVVEKRRLLGEVWADVHVTDSSLARAITQVRRAIGDDIRTPRYIETVPTRGYRFIGVLQPPPAGMSPAPEDPSLVVPAARAASSGPPSRWPVARAATAMLLVLLGLGGIRLAWQGAASQAAPADLVAVLLSGITHDAIQITTSRGLDTDPALSPDGTAVAYASDASGALEIHVRPRLAGATVRVLTENGGDNVDPAWSPDGQWLAYHSRRFGGVWLVPAAGGPSRQLVADGAAPSWSPDGHAIVFQTAGEVDILGGTGASPSTLAIVNVTTGVIEPLTRPADVPGSHGSPVWLPGHDTVVFVAARVPAADIWQVTRAGRVTRLGPCHAACRPFAFRQGDTTWVGTLRRKWSQELWLAPVSAAGDVDMSHARMTPLPRTLGVSDVSVARDGSQVAFTNAERTSEAWSVTLARGDASAPETPSVLLGERRPRYGEFAVSPDGARLAYTTSRLGDRPMPWLHDLETGTSRQLGTAMTGFVKGWAPDGRAIALLSEEGPLAVTRVDVLTGRAVPLLRLDHWAGVADVARRLFTLRLSPDFERYVYTTDDEARLAVWIGEVRGSGRDVRLARDVIFGAWSADGRQVAVQQIRGWRPGVAVVAVGGGVVRPLVPAADHAWATDWSPDGSHIVYAALRQGRWAIETVEVASGQVQRLSAPGAPAEYVRWPVWSPRGDRIVYERGYWTGNVWVAPMPGT
jgi:Tol biopolymer transport system component/DNA-binding winged helix-turn-helix (wHTH) protein